MSNPYYAPRPNPIYADARGDGWTVDDYLEPDRLKRLLEENDAWLGHGEHYASEIYETLFRHIDPESKRIREGKAYLCQQLWGLGYRPFGRVMIPTDPLWKWAGES